MLHAKSMALAFLLLTLFSSCQKEDTVALTQEKELPPAQHIAKSEQLHIPEVVAVETYVPKGSSRVATYYATGVQKYAAQYVPGTYPLKYEWVFVAPQADLFDVTNKKIGTHGAGPFWELSPADSLFAQQFTPARKTPSPDANSIDWLLLMPKAGKTATGIFKDVMFIQRIATVGGKAPATPPTSQTQTAEVPYTAVYRFTKGN